MPADKCQTLYTEHHSWLTRWLARRLGNPFDAADIAQDVFVRLLRREPLGDIQQPRAYLSRIAQGILVDQWRRQSLERAWLDALEQSAEEVTLSLEQQAILLETLQALDAMLDGLKPKVRRAFLYAQLDGLSYRQIADKLDVSLSTVERYIAQALKSCYRFHFEVHC